VTERTLVLVKPDGVQRRLVGEVVSRIERKGLSLVAAQLRTVDPELAVQHYAEHDGKPFFGELLEFITSGPVLAAVVEGPRAIAAFRQLAGGTDPVENDKPQPKGGIAGKERILCLDFKTGEKVWEHVYDCLYERVNYPSGLEVLLGRADQDLGDFQRLFTRTCGHDVVTLLA
jgi:nucleoside-diphosphate kinase